MLTEPVLVSMSGVIMMVAGQGPLLSVNVMLNIMQLTVVGDYSVKFLVSIMLCNSGLKSVCVTTSDVRRYKILQMVLYSTAVLTLAR